MNRTRWIIKEFEWLGRRAIHAVTGNYYVDKSKFAEQGMISDEEANTFIYNGLINDKPFAVGRTGFGEIGMICCGQNEIYFNSKVHYHWTPSYINVRKFKKTDNLIGFRNLTIDAMGNMDAMGTYADMFMSDAVLEMVPNIKNIKIFDIGVISAHNNISIKWTQGLSGKKILIVSPFFREIQTQYKKRNLLWKDGRIPECDIEYDPSLWISELGFFKAFEVLSERVLSRDFDIALLSCGSVGVPLASKIKQSGRKAIVMGSAMHILFGLKGKRWDNSNIYNEYWIRPSDDTKPAYADRLDGSTYW